MEENRTQTDVSGIQSEDLKVREENSLKKKDSAVGVVSTGVASSSEENSTGQSCQENASLDIQEGDLKKEVDTNGTEGSDIQSVNDEKTAQEESGKRKSVDSSCSGKEADMDETEDNEATSQAVESKETGVSKERTGIDSHNIVESIDGIIDEINELLE